MLNFRGVTLDHPRMNVACSSLLSIDLRNHQPEKVAQNGPKCTDRVRPSDVESLHVTRGSKLMKLAKSIGKDTSSMASDRKQFINVYHIMLVHVWRIYAFYMTIFKCGWTFFDSNNPCICSVFLLHLQNGPEHWKRVPRWLAYEIQLKLLSSIFRPGGDTCFGARERE